MIRVLFGFNAVKKDDQLFVQRLVWLEERLLRVVVLV